MTIAGVEAAFFDACPFAADVSRVDGDVQFIKWFVCCGRRQLFRHAPPTRGCFGGSFICKPQHEDLGVFTIGRADADFIFADFHKLAPAAAGHEKGGEQALEFTTRDGALMRIERFPIGHAT